VAAHRWKTSPENLTMSRPRPTILTALVWAYWDLHYALRTNWRSALLATGILSIGSVTALIVPKLLTTNPIGEELLRLPILIGLCFLLTPFLLAIHRLVLLGEQAMRYDLRPSSPRFQLFFGWLAVSALIVSIPSFLAALTAPEGPVTYLGERPAELDSSIIVPAARVVAFLVMQRLFVLFPAIAVDAPGATWQNAASDTRGHLWFSLVVTILPFIPLRFLGIAAASLLGFLSGTSSVLIASTLWLGVMFLVSLTLGSVIASRLYQLTGDRLNTALP
jgi:hypothetical protein